MTPKKTIHMLDICIVFFGFLFEGGIALIIPIHLCGTANSMKPILSIIISKMNIVDNVENI